MRPRAFLPLLLAAAFPAMVGAQALPLDGTEWAQLSIHKRIVIRILRPARLRSEATLVSQEAGPEIRWVEKKAKKCVPLEDLAMAAVTNGGDVDLMMADGKRMRAKLDDDCPTLDFYSGFYVKPNPDGMLCGGRDSFRARSGAACGIERFRTLVARR